MFERVVAYGVAGIDGIGGAPDVTLYSSPDVVATLTTNSHTHLVEADTDEALRRAAVKAIFHGTPVADLTDGITTLRKEREQLVGQAACLIVRVRGDYAVDASKVHTAPSGVRLGMDLIDKDTVRSSTRERLQRVLVGFLASMPVVEIHELVDAVYLRDETDSVIYTLNPRASMTHNTALLLTGPQLSDLKAIIASVATKEMSTVFRLATEASDALGDRLRRFVAAWTSLEVLLHRVFLANEAMLSTPPPTDPVDLKRPVGRFSLVQRYFNAANAEAEIAMFKNVKSVRDRLFHGEDIDDKSLPIHDTRQLIFNLLRLPSAQRP